MLPGFWLLFVFSLNVFFLVNKNVSDPYMDEIFHIPQVQTFCSGNIDWDPKITTFPGLYIFTLGYLGVLSIFTQTFGYGFEQLCQSIWMLRSVNLLFAVGNAATLVLIIQHKKLSNSSLSAINAGIIIALFPVLYFFNFLYYTDPGSLFFVLLTYYFNIKQRNNISGMLSICALSFRQTNIIWCFFCTFTAVLESWERQSKKNRGILHFAAFVNENKWIFLKQHSILVATAVGFVAFICWNGGIVLGDKESHAPVFNFGQIIYFAGFSYGFLMFNYHIGLWNIQQTIRSSLHNTLDSKNLCILSAALVAFCSYAAKNFSPAHSYLLADNRHYTFYLWKNFLRHEVVRMILTPCVLVVVHSFWLKLKGKKSAIWYTTFLVTNLVVLCPSLLLEFRYFIVPFILLRLELEPGKLDGFELGGYTLINALTLYIFLYRPFLWPNNEIARFMW